MTGSIAVILFAAAGPAARRKFNRLVQLAKATGTRRATPPSLCNSRLNVESNHRNQFIQMRIQKLIFVRKSSNIRPAKLSPSDELQPVTC